MAVKRAQDEAKVKIDQVSRKKKSMAVKRAEDETKVKIDQVSRKKHSRANQRSEDEEKYKENLAKQKRENIAKQRTEDEANVKKDQVNRKKDSRINQRAEDVEKVKENQKKWSRLSRCKRKREDHQKLKEDQNARVQKHRKIDTATDRLASFKSSTLHNAIFICTCCHQRMFKSNVRLYTKELAGEINAKKPGHTEKCIDELITTQIDGRDNCYICLTCTAHMKKRKIPPMSILNGLKLTKTYKMLKDQNLDLTELEGALIAKNIIFQKIYQLPKSRWTALKDKIVNVPINEG